MCEVVCEVIACESIVCEIIIVVSYVKLFYVKFVCVVIVCERWYVGGGGRRRRRRRSPGYRIKNKNPTQRRGELQKLVKVFKGPDDPRRQLLPISKNRHQML